MEFSRQEYWSGSPCSLPENFSNPGIKPRSPPLWVVSLLSEPPEKPKNTGVGSCPFFRGYSWTRDWTGVSCIAGGVFSVWATREEPFKNVKATFLAHGPWLIRPDLAGPYFVYIWSRVFLSIEIIGSCFFWGGGHVLFHLHPRYCQIDLQSAFTSTF